MQYKLATKQQAWALFRRFFPESRFPGIRASTAVQDTDWADTTSVDNKASSPLSRLADEFADLLPDGEFSTAELQGYLLMHKKYPSEAVSGTSVWIAQERREKQEREDRENKRKEKLRESRLKAKAAVVAELVSPLQQQSVPTNGVISPTSTDAATTTETDLVTQPDTVTRYAPSLDENHGLTNGHKMNGINH